MSRPPNIADAVVARMVSAYRVAGERGALLRYQDAINRHKLKVVDGVVILGRFRRAVALIRAR